MALESLFEWVSLPFAAARVFSSAKTFTGPVLGSDRLNRRGLHVWRTRLAHRLADRRRARLAHLVSAEDRKAFERDGFVMHQNFLPPEVFSAAVEQISRLSVPAREMREGDAITRRIPVTEDVLRQAPALRQLLEHPVWRGLTRYISSFNEPPLVAIQTIFGKAGTAVEDPQTSLHMDTFHPTMKAWFFLHDVADEEGPFTYVPGSHRLTPRRLAWQKRQSVLASTEPGRKGGALRIRKSELPRLGWPPPRRFAVPGNTLVVGDTCGFHARAHSDRPTMRLEIYAFSRPNPFKPFARGGGLGSVPFVGPRRALIGWWLEDRLAPLGLMRRVWRDVGKVSPRAPAGA